MGNNTGIDVPPENPAELGSGKKPAVTVSIASYSYASTVAVMGGKYLIPLSKAHREASGLKGGDTVEVTLELETAPRTTPIPEDLAEALNTAGATERFEALAFSKRKEFVRQIEEAKTPETRARRIEKILGQL